MVPNKTSNTMYRLSDSNLFTSDSQGRYIRLAHRMDTARLQWSSPYSDWFLGPNKKPIGVASCTFSVYRKLETPRWAKAKPVSGLYKNNVRNSATGGKELNRYENPVKGKLFPHARQQPYLQGASI